MQLAQPYWILLIPFGWAILYWIYKNSEHPMPQNRRKSLFYLRGLIFTLISLSLSQPSIPLGTDRETQFFILDHSQSMGKDGYTKAWKALHELSEDQRSFGVLSVAEQSKLLLKPGEALSDQVPIELVNHEGKSSHIADAFSQALGYFPPQSAKRIILLSDGLDSQNALIQKSKDLALEGIRVDVLPISGPRRPDFHIQSFQPLQTKVHEKSTVQLKVQWESYLTGPGQVHLFENGVKVQSQAFDQRQQSEGEFVFTRTPPHKGLYTYEVQFTDMENDHLKENNKAQAIVHVSGQPQILFVEGEEEADHALTDALQQEGFQLEKRPAAALPEKMEHLIGYDGIILSDCPARLFNPQQMLALRDYVEQDGGGLLTIGGKQSFGVGGYFRTPLEEILPVRVKIPDQEEIRTVALALVLDRSGSMSGHKLEICKSAAVMTADLLSPKDFLAVVAFDSMPHWVVPLDRIENSDYASAVLTINSGGGTSIYPAMKAAGDALMACPAKVRHMIVLTDGHSSNGPFAALSHQLQSKKITVSTVAVGHGADQNLLKMIASAGGGEYYFTPDPKKLVSIFTEDTMTHTQRTLREEPFQPVQIENHPILNYWPVQEAPNLLGYVRTLRKATSQVLLVTDMDDPLLATWRFGLGKVTAFTSDAKNRWSTQWISNWKSGYTQFWKQTLRETIREPESRFLTVQVKQEGQHLNIQTDFLESPAQFANGQKVTAQIVKLPEQGLKPKVIATKTLTQQAPGRYTHTLSNLEEGVYFVHVSSGARRASSGIVFQSQKEHSTGRIDHASLKKVAQLTGGVVLGPKDRLQPIQHEQKVQKDIDLYLLLLVLFLAWLDLLIRRWDNVEGILEKLGLKKVQF